MAFSGEVIAQIQSGKYDNIFSEIYLNDSCAIKAARERYIGAIVKFEELFGKDRDIRLFSAPGRTEIGGNHTDHNNGCVLAASINLDIIAVASKSNEPTIRVKSEGFEGDTIQLPVSGPKQDEVGHSAALIRGICHRCSELGFNTGGFDCYTTSNVLKGSGLSSSAAFEIVISTIISEMFNDGKIDPIQKAQISKYSENVFFGKPSGLMDQMASSVGSFVAMDFKDTNNPIINKVDFDFSAYGYSLCIVDTGGSHADLTDDYAACRKEMNDIARAMGREVLREVDPQQFYSKISALRSQCGDRAVLRAIHFFEDNQRVAGQVKALQNKDFEQFLHLVRKSGYSSFMYLQNIFSPSNLKEQGLSLALALSEKILKGKGAWRVHGGGFAGTIQAFVPNELLDTYLKEMRAVFGEKCCYVLSIRPYGGIEITKMIN